MMVNPVPGNDVDTPYGKRGSYWSCNEDSNGNGIHTGVDIAAPHGTTVVAARPGKVVHCSHGSSFGYHQVEILPGDGTRDFYAHMHERIGNGVQVKAGDKIGEIGSEGNVTGPHLHFERHKVATGGWSCSIIVDPAPSLNYDAEPEDEMKAEDWDQFRKIVREEIDKNNEDLVNKVWNEPQTVTKPNGETDDKSMREVQRENWQRIAKLD